MPFVNAISGKFGFGRSTKPGNINGSIRFTGTPQYLESPTLIAIGTSTATVEFWFYADSNAGSQRMATTSLIGFVSNDFSIRFASGSLVGGAGASTSGPPALSAGITSSTTPTAGAWHHVAWVGVSGTSQSLFLDGNRVGTAAAYNLSDTKFYLGGRNLANEYFIGNISNFRYVRGTAVYNGATYTVPIKPLEAISGTELLLKTIQGNSVKADSSVNVYTMIDRGGGGTSSSLTPFA
jgi:hypothetical protein